MNRPPLDRSHPPPPEAPHPFRFPPFTRRRLSNGLDLLICRWAKLPLVHLEILTQVGGLCDPPGREGLASLHGDLLDDGTARRSSVEMSRTVESWGGSLGSGSDWDAASVEIDVLERHLPAALDLLAEILRAPSFPDDELERLRRRRLTEILRRRDQPSMQAYQATMRAIYGDGLYGAPLIGTEESVGELRREDCLELYRHYIDPERVTLLAVGDVDPEDIVRRAESALGDWRTAGIELPQPPEVAPLEARKILVIDRPQAAQSELRLGHRGLARTHPDHAAVVVMNGLYGGKFTSRINLNLREKHGFTYGASSNFYYRRGPGPLMVRAAVATEHVGASTRELLAEMERIREEPVGAEELRETQDYLIGTVASSLQTVSAISRRLEILAVHGFPETYYEHYPAVLKDVTSDDVLDAARRHLDPERIAIVAVGPAETLRPQLEGLGPVTVL